MDKKMKLNNITLTIFFLVCAGVQPAQTIQTAITYDFSGGRLGDNLLSYLHAKWFAYKYQIPLLYRPFPYSSELVLSEEELSYEEWASHFEDTYRFGFGCTQPTFPGLFFCPCFPEIGWEIQRHVGFFEKVDWKDKDFRRQVRKLVSPKTPLDLTYPPEDKVSIAIHIREGGGFDDEEHKLKHPTKTPPFTFYVESLVKILDLFRGKPLYCHVFTDYAEPQELIDKMQRSLPADAPIAFHYRKENNHHNSYVLEDFFSLFNFDILIRAESNYSVIPSLINDYAVVCFPVAYSFHNVDEVKPTPAIHPINGIVVTIDEIHMDIDQELYNKCLEK
jgi:hypothetical protein